MACIRMLYTLIMNELDTLITTLKLKPEVDSVFVTGSVGRGEATTSSDLDLVVVLSANPTGIRSAYQYIDGTFSDIFFFTTSEVEEVLALGSVDANDIRGMLVSWVQQGMIRFDTSGAVTRLAAVAQTIELTVSVNEKENKMHTISYDFLRCERYVRSDDVDKQMALELMLPSAVLGLVVAFLTLRDEPWRGEREAMRYIKAQDEVFYELYGSFVDSTSLRARMQVYRTMITRTLPPPLKMLDYTTPFALPRDASASGGDNAQELFWKMLATPEA